MSFGFGGSGFGQNNANNNQQLTTTTGFGGFGAGTTGTAGGFGATNTGGFGTTSAPGNSLFGGGSTSGFGGFGSNNATTNNTSGFGAAPASTGAGMFGTNTATSGASTGFGGFGAPNTTQNANPFGGAAMGQGLFGTAKPAFGNTATTGTSGSSLFGNAGSTNTGFGSSGTAIGGAFGAGASTALGAANAECQGTGAVTFQVFIEKEGNTSQINHFQTISVMQPYQRFSFEELRLADYTQGRRYGNANNQAGAFGTSTGFGGFGNTSAAGTGFGATNTATTGGGLFGNTGTTGTPFGQAQLATNPFGVNNANSGGLFGAKPAGSGLFGAATTAPATGGNMFGATNNTSTAFGGGSTGSSLFGNSANNNAAKPAGFGFGTSTGTGFGPTSNTGAFGAPVNNTASTGGGLFGNMTATASPFGAQQNNTTSPFGQAQNTTTGNSLFGNIGQANQAKPAGGLFGNTATNAGAGMFGQVNQQQQQQQQQQQAPASGGLFGNAASNTTGGLFGAKPFGQATATTNPTGGLFGNLGGANNNNGTATAGGGLFGALGSSNNNQPQQTQGAGLFGNVSQQQQKPGGLFGSMGTSAFNSGATGGGGLFAPIGSGVNSNDNNMFQQQQQQPQQNGNNSFAGFGNGSSQQGGMTGSSLYGTPSQSQSFNQPQSFSTSIQDRDPYGSASLFSGLAMPTPEYAGPLATPVSSAKKPRGTTLLQSSYKMNPASASRLITPQKRGYGFSYSTYGTPNSVSSSSASTPMGLGGSMLGGTLGRSLAKSQSTSSLRRTFDSSADSVLSPGAFSTTNSRRIGGSSSLKKLSINRNLRSDLFAPPTPMAGALPAPNGNQQGHEYSPTRGSSLKKRVSFEARTEGGNGSGDVSAGEEINIFSRGAGDSAVPSAEELASKRPSTRSSTRAAGAAKGSSASQGNGPTNEPAPDRHLAATSGNTQEATKKPEMEQVKGKELAIVHEEDGPRPPSKSVVQLSGEAPLSHDDEQMGNYWIKPPMSEIRKLSLLQRRRVPGVIIGREGGGQVEFQESVDLTGIDLDNFFETLVVIRPRAVTLYPISATKPTKGKGMNVPSIIRLHNSWPRSRRGRSHMQETSGPEYDKHLKRLKKVPDTEFLDYDSRRGVWSFRVPHFTTYGLDYDDDDTVLTEGDLFDDSVLSAAPDTPTPKSRVGTSTVPLPRSSQSNGSIRDVSMISAPSPASSSGPDDTFEFRRSTSKALPGAFDGDEIFQDHDEMDMRSQEHSNGGQSFLGDRSVGSILDSVETDLRDDGRRESVMQDDGSDLDEDREMAGSFPTLDLTTERLTDLEASGVDRAGLFSRDNMRATPMKSILKGSRGFGFGPPGATPGRRKLDLEGDWTEQLGRTISPRKCVRATLKESQAPMLKGPSADLAASIPSKKPIGHAIHNSIDLMKSLFDNDPQLKWLYAKRCKTVGSDLTSMDPWERSFHESNKPEWAMDGTLVYARSSVSPTSSGRSDHTTGILVERRKPFVTEGKDVHFAKFAASQTPAGNTITLQREFTRFHLEHGVPKASLKPEAFHFQPFPGVIRATNAQSKHEKLVWELASVLFDDIDLDREIPDIEIADGKHSYFEMRVRKERLSDFWSRLVREAASEQAKKAEGGEERAIAYLSAHQVEDACGALLEGRNFRLATLIAMIGGDRTMRRDMKAQLTEWRRLKVLSEMTEPIRALYELLAGHVCVCEGNKGSPEDQARSFILSDRFNLDWRQSFGLRLWYAVLEKEPISVAIKQYQEDLLTHHEEGARPRPWYLEQEIPALWTDPNAGEREDLLWGLLKVYVSTQGDRPCTTSLQDILMPANHQVSPIDYRLAWQLQQTLSIHNSTSTTTSALDCLTTDYAWQLSDSGHWKESIYVLLHLSSPSKRQVGIQSVLSQHAFSLSSPEAFQRLTEAYLIPAAWIYEAQALYARSVTQDHTAEVRYLLQAGNLQEAHTTLCSVVAPRAVIEDDTPTLKTLLDGFGDGSKLADWAIGGAVYADYLRLLENTQHLAGLRHSRRKSSGQWQKRDKELVASLCESLPAMIAARKWSGFEVDVAVQEMGAVVGRTLLTSGAHDHSIKASKILSLPLTEDQSLKHTVDLSLRYYKAVMAGGTS